MFRGKPRPTERTRKRFIRLAWGAIISAALFVIYQAFWQVRTSGVQEAPVNGVHRYSKGAFQNPVTWDEKAFADTAGAYRQSEQLPFPSNGENAAPETPEISHEGEIETPKVLEFTHAGRVDPAVTVAEANVVELEPLIPENVPPDEPNPGHTLLDEIHVPSEPQASLVDVASDAATTTGMPEASSSSQTGFPDLSSPLTDSETKSLPAEPQESSASGPGSAEAVPRAQVSEARMPALHPHLLTLRSVASLSLAGFCPPGCDVRGVCNPETGTCECPPGMRGASCDLFVGEGGQLCPTEGSIGSTTGGHPQSMADGHYRGNVGSMAGGHHEGSSQSTPGGRKGSRGGTAKGSGHHIGGLCAGELPSSNCWQRCNGRGRCLDRVPPAHVLFSARAEAAKRRARAEASRADASASGDGLTTHSTSVATASTMAPTTATSMTPAQHEEALEELVLRGSCSCFPGYRGHACEDVLFPDMFCINACHRRGMCIQGFCLCRPGFWGIDCGYDLLLPSLQASAVPLLPLHPTRTSASSHKASSRQPSPPTQHGVVAFKRFSSHKAWCYRRTQGTGGTTSGVATDTLDGCHSSISVGAVVVLLPAPASKPPSSKQASGASLRLGPWLDHQTLANASLSFLAESLFGEGDMANPLGARAEPGSYPCEGDGLVPTLRVSGRAMTAHHAGQPAQEPRALILDRPASRLGEDAGSGWMAAAATTEGANGRCSTGSGTDGSAGTRATWRGQGTGSAADTREAWQGLLRSCRLAAQVGAEDDGYRLLADANVLADLDRLLPGLGGRVWQQLAAQAYEVKMGTGGRHPSGVDLAGATVDTSSPSHTSTLPRTPAPTSPRTTSPPSPRIFVYDLPPSLTVHPEDGSVATANFGNGPANLYSLEPRFHAALLRSRHRVLSPATADLLHAPVWDPIGAWGAWGAHVDAVRWLRQEHGELFESRPADHVWVVHRDLGSCGSPAPLAAGIFVTNWGGERGEPGGP
eukprot:jgi/Mesvir1/2012/Mv06195-RA.3